MAKALTVICALLVLFCGAGAQTDKSICPRVTISGLSLLPSAFPRPDDRLTFAVRVPTSDFATKLTYEWLVSSGTIVAGQETPQISVQPTPAEAGSSVTATVQVKGLPAGCPEHFSITATIAARGSAIHLDEFDRISWSDERGRLGNLAFALGENPEARGLIWIYLKSSGRMADAKKHIRKIRNHMKARYRKLGEERLLFMIERNAPRRTTRYWIVPKGAALPTCDSDCNLILGHDDS